MEAEEEKKKRISEGGSVEAYWWWALASLAQATAGVVYYRRGNIGDSRYMPVRAFAVASLIVGSGGTAVAACLNASGINTVKDLKDVGANIRNGMRIPPRDTKT